MYTDETHFFVNAGNMKKALAKNVGSVRKILVGSSSAPRPHSPPPSPPRARSARRGSTWRERTLSPLPAEESDEEDVEYDQEPKPDSEDESLDSEEGSEEEGEEEG